MTDDRKGRFGRDFEGRVVKRYKFLPALDGNFLGVIFEEPSGKKIRLAIPCEGLGPFIGRLMKVAMEMEEKRGKARR